MRLTQWSGGILLLFVAGIFLSSTGCGRDDKKGGDQQAKAKATKEQEPKNEGGKQDLDPKTKHDGWWCAEHGVPEHLCSLCSDEVVAKCKKEGDWCKLHDRALSQCFKCDPSKYAKFEAMYEAKYGKKPPPPKEEFEK